MAERPVLVKALHSYLPLNNDEIRLEQGEILTVTRKEDGGWWEGTLSNGKTGWFPSNYVEDILLVMSSSGSSTSPLSSLTSPMTEAGSPPQQQLDDKLGGSTHSLLNNGQLSSMTDSAQPQPIVNPEYRQIAFNELLDSETVHVQELQSFWEQYLSPLQKSEILTPVEFKTLIGNYFEVTNMHQNLVLSPLKAEQNSPLGDQRLGNIFLEHAPKFEEIHKTYCSNHPRAVQVVETHKEQLSIFIENKGGRKPGILYIITSLSAPFRRLEKYPTLLQEIERHVPEFHKDRGDLQRSIAYYKEIQKNCSALRKQKEMELEVLSGGIKDWEGSNVGQLGDIVFMNLVHIGLDRQPRYLVLFSSNTLLILSYNTETSELVYEGKVPVSGITLRPINEKDSPIAHAFEISGPMIDQIIVGCTSKSIRETWITHLNSILKTTRFPSFSSSPQQSFGHLTPPIQAWSADRLRPSPPFNPFLIEYLNNLKKQQLQQQRTGQGQGDNSLSSTTSLNNALHNSNKGFNNLNNNNSRSQSVGGGVPSTASIMSFNSGYSPSPTVTNEEEFAILALVDSFCTTNRHTVIPSAAIDLNKSGSNSASPVSNHLPPNQTKPRTLAQLVMVLHDDVSNLKKSLEDEQRKRIALEVLLQKSLNNNNATPINNNVPDA